MIQRWAGGWARRAVEGKRFWEESENLVEAGYQAYKTAGGPAQFRYDAVFNKRSSTYEVDFTLDPIRQKNLTTGYQHDVYRVAPSV